MNVFVFDMYVLIAGVWWAGNASVGQVSSEIGEAILRVPFTEPLPALERFGVALLFA